MSNNSYWVYSVKDKAQKNYMQRVTKSYVAFIDILGFKNMVLNDIEKVVLTLRQIKGFCAHHYKLDAPKRGEIGDKLDGMPYVTMFSDSVIITVSAEQWWLHNFVELITDLQYFLLTQGVLIRGGIDIGDVFHDKDYVFGNGIVRAYMIECMISKYPRIVVSNRAMNYASNVHDRDFNEFLEFEMKMSVDSDEIYDNIDELFSQDMYDRVSQDKHGIYYLEYLIRGALSSDDDERQRELDSIRDTIDKGLLVPVESVREKYVWLNDYFNRVFYCSYESEEEKQQKKDRKEKEYEIEKKRLEDVFKKEADLAIAFEKNTICH